MALAVVLRHFALVDRHSTPSLVAGADDHPGAGCLKLVVQLAGDVERPLDSGVGGDNVGQKLLERSEIAVPVARPRPAKLSKGPPDKGVGSFRRLPWAPQGASTWVGISHRPGSRRYRQRPALVVPGHLIARERVRQCFCWFGLSYGQLLPMPPGRPRHVQQRTDPSHVAARDVELLADLRHRLRPHQGIQFFASDHAGLITESPAGISVLAMANFPGSPPSHSTHRSADSYSAVMERSPLIPESTWLWAWRPIAAWSGLDLNPRAMSARERWSVAVVVVSAVAKSRYLRPLRLWFLARTPAWAIALRLERASHRWFRIPDRAAAERVMVRFDFYPLDAGDHVLIERGRLTAVGYAGREWSENIYLMPEGQIEPDPHSPEMTRAWAAFWKSKGG